MFKRALIKEMPINCLTGLQGSGKSYECVKHVILPALAKGRRVVTNVDGINNDLCRQYVHDKEKIPLDKIGNVVHCKNDDVDSPTFFPFGSDDETFCQGGDLVCIDEAWRHWGTGNKIHKNHQTFFCEHRHYVHPETKVSCDLVLMVQDVSTLHRTLKVLIELIQRTRKLKVLGASKSYRVDVYEGHKIAKANHVTYQIKRYSKEIFPLYSSYVGGHGVETQVDSRQNVLKGTMLWVSVIVCFIVLYFGLKFTFEFFSPRTDATNEQIASSDSNSGKSQNSTTSQTVQSSKPEFSETWRIAGSFYSGAVQYIVLKDMNGKMRLEHPSSFMSKGLTLIGSIDGEKVTLWSGKELEQGNVVK